MTGKRIVSWKTSDRGGRARSRGPAVPGPRATRAAGPGSGSGAPGPASPAGPDTPSLSPADTPGLSPADPPGLSPADRPDGQVTLGPVRSGPLGPSTVGPETGGPGPAGSVSDESAAPPGSVPPGSVPAGLAPAGSAPPPRGPRSGRRDAQAGRKPKSGLRLTRRARIIGVLVVVAALLSVGLTTGFGSEPSAQPAVQSFLLAWQQQRYEDAGALTTSPPATVAAALKNAFAQLDATQLFLTMDSVTQHGSTAQASFTASVDLAGGHVWSYRGQFGLSHGDGDWKVQWSPSVVYPGLGQGQRLAVVTQFPDRAPVLDAEGQPLQVLGSVYILGVTPAKLANPAATATAFAKITNLDGSQVLGQIEAAPPQQVLELASLDPTTYASLRSALQDVPGLVVQQQRKRLFQAEATGLIGGVGNEINPVLRNEGAYYVPGTTVGLSGLEQTYQRQLLGTPTTEVVAVTPGGTQTGVLARWPGAAGTPVRTTISAATQDAALSALNGVPGSGDIVAVRASTGEVLAIAQRHGSGSAGVDALNAKLTPGPAFTIVSAAALLASGLTGSSQLTCGKSLTLDGRTFTSPGTGSSVPFSKAFAEGCSTALASASQRLTAGELDQAARDFGIGANWSGLPVPAFSGSVPANASRGQLAAETLGQGNVQMSPLAMAMVAAAVDSGRWHTPRFLAGSADPAGTALSPGNMSQLRGLMRTAVTSGSAQAASASGDPVYGQVGLVHAGSTWTSWFVGFRGDIAFTVVESGPTAQLSAAALASAFLSALGS